MLKTIFNYRLIKTFTVFLPFLAMPLFSQEVTVFGQVTTVTAGMVQPLTGAHIFVGNDPEMGDYSDEDGYYEFTFLWLWDGPITATCTAEGYQPASETFLPEGLEYQVDFQLSPVSLQDAALFGHVYEETSSGDISVPLPDALVQIFGGFTGGLLAETLTDSTGYYEFGDVAYAAYEITVELEGYIGQDEPLEGYSNEPVELDFFLQPQSSNEVGWVFGLVTGQLSPEGPTFPIGGALISATPAWGPEPNPATETNENGEYILELQASEIPWIITCVTELGTQQSDLVIQPDAEQELNFHFNAWEYPQLSPPRSLAAEQDPSVPVVFLTWETPFHVPDDCQVQYRIYAHFPDMPENQWDVLGETSDLNWEHQPEFPDDEPYEICYRVTALCDELESLPSNIACVWNMEPTFPPPPVDLTAWYDPSNGLGGTAILNWLYPPLPDPDMVPVFNIYANLGWQSGYEYVFAGQTSDLHFEYLFGDFVALDSTICFRVTAVIGDLESDFSNQACFNPYDPNENGVLYGTIYFQSEDFVDVVPGALITAVHQVSGVTYDAVSGNDGSYEMEVLPGPYLITCELPSGESLVEDAVVPPGAEIRVDFYFGFQPIEPILAGMVYGLTIFGETIPIWNAHLVLWLGDMQFETYTEEGNYWVDLPQPGLYSVEIEAEGYVGLADEIWVGGFTEQDFYLAPLDNMFPAILTAGSGTVLPGDTIAIPIFLENTETVAGIQFTLADDPNWLTAVDYPSELDCFSTSFNEVGGGVITVFFSPEGCSLEPGEYNFATLYYLADEGASLGDSIDLFFADLIISDPMGNSIPAEAGNAVVVVGLPGDINQDGMTDILDIVALVTFVIQAETPDDYQFWAGDLNVDGDLNILDVVRLVNLILDSGL
ncbi:MAG: hypothetical protein GXO91_09990 [FCB group bacterium]|nr:hypothetical protein [FCB group bacterium]